MKKNEHRNERAKKLMAAGGKYAKGGSVSDKKHPDEAQDKKLIKKMIIAADGKSAGKRLDKRKRYASGGGIDDDSPKSKKSGAKTEVNIMIAGKGQPSAPPMPMTPPPMPAGPPPAPPMPAGAPPMPPQGMPQGMPMKPPGAFARGGAAKYPIDAGAGGGKGRLEKAAAQKNHRNGKTRANED